MQIATKFVCFVFFFFQKIAMRLLVLSVAFAAILTTCNASLASVTYTEDHKFLVQDGVVENWVAKANLTHKYYETGYVSKVP